MDRLFRRRDAEARRDRTADLEPIRVYAPDIVVAGWTTPFGERITDLLHRGESVPFLPDGADPADPDSWLDLVPSSVLIVVPPPHVSPPEKRIHRQTQQVGLRVGPYRVTGTAHLRPGFEQDLVLRATQPFLPLTDASVTTEDPPWEVRYDVVIVNLGAAEELREL
jgi:hypothetical protein